MEKKLNGQNILLGAIVVLLTIIVFKGSTQYVSAQADGDARHVFGLIGQRQGNREPLYLIDTREQAIMVYEYSVQGEGLGLVTARSYKYDKELEDFGRSFGYDIEKVRSYLARTQYNQSFQK